MSRNFEIKQAVRSAVPLLIGLFGPSGSGKTYTALRLATGIQRIFKGDILFIDTESRRALHYASIFKFKHIEFKAPFGSMDYLEVLKYAEEHQPAVVVVDSLSHEHEGEGGMLDFQEKELDRMAGNDYGKRNSCKMLAWAKPKGARRKLINGLLQLNANFIFCFRAKETSKPTKNPTTKKMEVENFGFMPIAGSEFVYEMTINCMLPPHANGVPDWKSDNKGEAMMMKLPEQFKSIFNKPGIQLDENIGQKLAEWAKGDGVAVPKDNRPTAQETEQTESGKPSDGFQGEKTPLMAQFDAVVETVPRDAATHYRNMCDQHGWTDDVLTRSISDMGKLSRGEALD